MTSLIQKPPPLPSVAAPQKKPTPPPSPPSVMQDKRQTVHFTKGRLLGQGGFARCYEVFDPNGIRFASKVIPKQSLKSQKQKQKLFTEIKLHQHLRHANIVRFHQVFEDSENVYMILELCENRTLVELLKKRRRLSEPEARFYLKQLLDAIQYMHSKRVIHRDLKLGNLFLDAQMDLKIGDFGLATLVKQDGERKKTICGTPNYIAPEILFHKNGHSFEVDLWSYGVIMYTLLVGRPPFQTKDVKEIYKNIKENRYAFPEGVDISPQARALIGQLLMTEPTLRLGIHEVGDHAWFRYGETVPNGLSMSATAMAAALLSKPQNPARVLQTAGSKLPTSVKPLAPKDFNSPASVKPLAAKDFNSPLAPQQHTKKPNGLTPSKQMPQDVVEDLKTRLKHAQIDQRPTTAHHEPAPNKENNLPRMTRSRAAALAAATMEPKSTAGQEVVLASKTPNAKKMETMPVLTSTPEQVQSKFQLTPIGANGPQHTGRKSMLEMMFVNLSTGLKSFKEGTLSSVLLQLCPSDTVVQTPKVFVSKWIDYSNKYGLGYQLTNGSVGVYFNDSTSIILSANDVNFEYLEYARGSEKTVMNRHGYQLTQHPDHLQKKVTLLKHFKSYMQEHLYNPNQYSYKDDQSVHNLDFLVKYMRTKHAVLFRLTNRVVQINFFDHTKLILSKDAQVITFINRERQLVTLSLADILSKQENEIISRLKYARDILETLTQGRANGTSPKMDPKKDVPSS